MTVCPSNFFFPIHFHVTGNKMFQSNKMNQSIHCWGQSGGVRAGVPGHAVGLRVVSWWGGGFSLQALRGSVPCHGSGVQLQPSLPSPTVYIILGRVFLLSAVVLSFLTTFILVSFASQLFPRTRKHNLVSAFISFLTGVEQAGKPCCQAGLSLGKGLGRGPKAGRWLVSVVSGERIFRDPLTCGLL